MIIEATFHLAPDGSRLRDFMKPNDTAALPGALTGECGTSVAADKPSSLIANVAAEARANDVREQHAELRCYALGVLYVHIAMAIGRG